MKKILYFFLMVLLLSNLNNESHGIDVRTNVTSTGNSTVDVKTSVSSTNNSTTKSNVYRKSEITVNGEKQVFESNEEGTTEIKVVGNENGITTTTKQDSIKENGSASISPIPSITPSIMPKQFDIFKNAKQTTFQEYILNWIKNIFKRIF